MRKTLALYLLLLFPLLVSTQSYDTAMGMRLGTDWGLSIQQRVAKRTTIEAIFQNSFRRDEAMLTIMGEQHMNFITRRFNLYTGGGLHKGWANPEEGEDYQDPWGLSLIAGLELSLGRLNLSYDIKPAFNLQGGDRFLYIQSGLSLRYVILKRNFLDIDKKQRQRKRRKRKRNRDDDWKFWKDW